jgi:hypothetical protein
LCLAFSIPTFDRETRALWIGRRVEAHMRGHGRRG